MLKKNQILQSDLMVW